MAPWLAGGLPPRSSRCRANTPTAGVRVLSAVLVVAATLLAQAAPALAGNHTVRAGETLADIARANGTTVQALAVANGISNPNYIVVGQVLTIPSCPARALSGRAPGRCGRDAVGHCPPVWHHDRDPCRRQWDYQPERRARRPDRHHSHGRPDGRRGRRGPRGSIRSPRARPWPPSWAATASAWAPSPTPTIWPTPAWCGSVSGSPSLRRRAAGADRGVVAAARTTPRGAPTDRPVSGYPHRRVGRDPSDHRCPPWRDRRRPGRRQRHPAAVPAVRRRSPVSVGPQLPSSRNIDQCPIKGASYTNDWGMPRPGGRGHAGTDLLAKAGTPVHAPVSGILNYLTGTRGGLQFWLKGDDGNRYIGAHLQKEGKSVASTPATPSGTSAPRARRSRCRTCISRSTPTVEKQ